MRRTGVRGLVRRVRRAAGPERAPSAPPPRRASSPGFFDGYPRFFETSATSAAPTRLNLRYEAIFGENADVFAGARVLDIASHDGRWSLAALRNGAASVVGVEPREELVRAAEENLREYAPDGASFRFVAGDAFEVLARERFDVDVVLCLGFLYHTLRYNELLHWIRACAPRHLMIDTAVSPARKSFVRLSVEPAARQGNAVLDAYSFGDVTLVGWPSVAALELMLDAYGFAIEGYSDWQALLAAHPEADNVGDYAKRRRVTVRAARVR